MNRIAKAFFLSFLFAGSLFAQKAESGLCSFYSDLFHGKPTASGELYDKNKLTAAHKTLPFGTVVRVTRTDNKKSIQVKINDRGPFISGRVLEVSREAATRLGLEKDGSAPVTVEVVKEKTDEPAAPAAAAATTEKEPKPESYEVKDKPKDKDKGKDKPAAADDKKATDKKGAAVKVKDTTKPADKLTEKGAKAKPVEKEKAPKAVLVKGKDYKPFDLYQIELKRPEKKGFGVQVASFTDQDAMLKKIADLQGGWFDNVLVSIEQDKKKQTIYKVILGPFTTEAEAKTYKSNLKKNKKIDGFVVNLTSGTESK